MSDQEIQSIDDFTGIAESLGGIVAMMKQEVHKITEVLSAILNTSLIAFNFILSLFFRKQTANPRPSMRK